MKYNEEDIFIGITKSNNNLKTKKIKFKGNTNQSEENIYKNSKKLIKINLKKMKKTLFKTNIPMNLMI